MQCRRRAFVRRLGTRRRKSQPYSVLWEGVSLKCMFMLCARFMTSRVNVNNAICKRSVHEISFKRSAFDFMHSDKLCRWRYLLSLGEESMRACNINIHLSDTTPSHSYCTASGLSSLLRVINLQKTQSLRRRSCTCKASVSLL